ADSTRWRAAVQAAGPSCPRRRLLLSPPALRGRVRVGGNGWQAPATPDPHTLTLPRKAGGDNTGSLPRPAGGGTIHGRSTAGAAMEYRVTCGCGRAVAVGERAAGARAACPCGRTVDVPSLRELR